MVADISPLQIRRLETSEAALYRDIRLEALKSNPEAFSSTFEKENAQPLSWFEGVVGRADIFGAFLDGVLVGVAGFAAPEGSKQAHKGPAVGHVCSCRRAKYGSWKKTCRSGARPCARAR